MAFDASDSRGRGKAPHSANPLIFQGNLYGAGSNRGGYVYGVG